MVSATIATTTQEPLVQGLGHIVTLTEEGIAKRFVTAHGSGGMYTSGVVGRNGTPMVDRPGLRFYRNEAAFESELSGHAGMSGYFPVPGIIATDRESTTITYEAFPDQSLRNIRLDYLVRRGIANADELGREYDIHEDPFGRALIAVNLDIGKRLRRMHDATHRHKPGEHTIEGTLDLHDRNVLVRINLDGMPAEEGDFYRVIDFESYGRGIDVYDSFSNLIITEMVTAGVRYIDEEQRNLPFRPEYIDLIEPALKAFVRGYMAPDGERSVPDWFTDEKMMEYKGMPDNSSIATIPAVFRFSAQQQAPGISKYGILYVGGTVEEILLWDHHIDTDAS